MSEYREREEYRRRRERQLRAAKRRRRRRRQRALLCALLAVIAAVIFLLARCAAGKGKDGGAAADGNASETTFASSSLTVNGVSLSGLTLGQAKAELEKQYPWNMTISCGGETISVDNLIDAELDAFLEETVGTDAAGDYTFSPADSDALAASAAAAAETAAKKWDIAAKNGSISAYDAASDQFVFAEGTPGRAVNRDALVSDLIAAVKAGNYSAALTAQVSEVQPELTAAEAREQYERLGSFTTTTTANEKRNTNVRLAAQALNGTIIQPGEEFSFNKIVGQRTAEKGYQEAAAYNSGDVVQEVGGGVCQMSSTLYHAAFQAGMEITYRRSHTFEPSYVTPGQDAAISWDLPDFRFVNTSKSAIGIRAGYSNRKATAAIYGVPVLEEGVTLSLESEKVEELPPPEPTYVEDQTLEPGVEVTDKAGTNGSRWVTYRIVSKNGEVVERTEDHAKTYKGHAAVIRRNTSGVVLSPDETTEAQTTAAPTVDGMPDGYVPGGSASPESSASAGGTEAGAGTSAGSGGTSEPGPAGTSGSGASGTSAAAGKSTEAASSAPETSAATIAPNSPADGLNSGTEANGPGSAASPGSAGGPGSAETEASSAGSGTVTQFPQTLSTDGPGA